ncbi:Uncharacterized protein TPAR_08119 [Tolypocladium paradoxum]|uniref:Uncharacterized protein n=1 Tax=Tolypocladium paradoxum TaxID=94208 RepID=A0A2S4KNA5_9HYPO|nr:Uncharacterized protein TPAR_08119 [Tolypocladium paradoxum]
MSSAWLMNLLQVFLAFIGTAWKLKEGYPLVELPPFPRLFEPAHEENGRQWLYMWIEILGGVSMESIMHDWPWFSLHLFLYIGQLIPFVVIIMNEWPSGRAWTPFSDSGKRRVDKLMARSVSLLGGLSVFFGFSTAMPVISLRILRGRQHRQRRRVMGRYQRPILSSMFLFSAATHVGAFLMAFIATWAPSMLGPRAAAPMHVLNSLAGVPGSTQVGVSGTGIRQARLRQINEMTGTSSGFFMTAGLLCRVLESKGQHMTVKLLAWMFLVSLVAGPAAGGAAILLLRDSIVGGDSCGNSAIEQHKKRVS